VTPVKIINHQPFYLDLTVRRCATATETRISIFEGDKLTLSVSLTDHDLAAMVRDRAAIGTIIAPPAGGCDTAIEVEGTPGSRVPDDDDADEPGDADATPLVSDPPEPTPPDFGVVSFEPDLGGEAG
jgi:hypothetical protein